MKSAKQGLALSHSKMHRNIYFHPTIDTIVMRPDNQHHSGEGNPPVHCMASSPPSHPEKMRSTAACERECWHGQVTHLEVSTHDLEGPDRQPLVSYPHLLHPLDLGAVVSLSSSLREQLRLSASCQTPVVAPAVSAGRPASCWPAWPAAWRPGTCPG